MTVSTTTTYNEAASGATVYYFTFRCDDADWVTVSIGGVLQSSGYTVALNADQEASPGGSVTLSAAAAATVKVKRKTTLTQETNYTAYDAFSAETHERALDKAFTALQDVERDATDALAVETAARLSADAAEAAARAATDALIIASGAMPANVGIAPVIATGSTEVRTVADRFADVVNVKDFGAVGDATYSKDGYNATTNPYGTVTGTDDTAAVQAAIDYAFANRKSTVFLPAGGYRFSDPLRLYTVTSGYRTVRLVGDGPMYMGEAPFGGTLLIADFSAGSLLDIRGGRDCEVSQMTIIGRNFAYLYAAGFLTATGPDFMAEENWIEPSLAAGGVSDVVDNPYCGISFNGSPVSSNLRLDHVVVMGFIAGLGVGTSLATSGNSDFVGSNSCSFFGNKVAIAVGQDQTRALGGTNCVFWLNFTGIDTDSYGEQDGRVGGAFVNCSFDTIARLVWFGSAAKSLGVNLVSCYGENIGSIGAFALVGGNSSSCMKISHTVFQFTGPKSGTMPSVNLRCGTDPVEIDACTFMVMGPFTYLGPVTFTNGTIILTDPSQVAPAVADTNAYRLANRGMSGLFPATTAPRTASISEVRYLGIANVDSGTNIEIQMTAGVGSGRSLPISAFIPKITLPQNDYVVQNIYDQIDLTVGPPTITRVDQITWTIDLGAQYYAERQKYIQAGDLAYWPAGEAFFRITTVVGTTLTLELVAGFSYLNGVYSSAINLSASGYLNVLSSRCYSVAPLWGTFTSGSAVITNVYGADGSFPAGQAPSAGDWLISFTYWQEYRGKPGGFGAMPHVDAVDTGTRTITLSAASSRSASDVPIGMWLRPT